MNIDKSNFSYIINTRGKLNIHKNLFRKDYDEVEQENSQKRKKINPYTKNILPIFSASNCFSLHECLK